MLLKFSLCLDFLVRSERSVEGSAGPGQGGEGGAEHGAGPGGHSLGVSCCLITVGVKASSG